MNTYDLDTPALVIDLGRVEANINEMAGRAKETGVRLRPHTKTHKIPEIARLQVDAGAAGITVAKVGEAEVMVAAGFDDVLIAYPIYGAAKLARLQALREKARILVSLDSLEVAEGLGRLGTSSGEPIEIYVEVDTGQHRMGRPPGQPTVDLIRQLAEVKGITIIGLMTHAGHTYDATSLSDRDLVVDKEIADLVHDQRDGCRGGRRLQRDQCRLHAVRAQRNASRRRHGSPSRHLRLQRHLHDQTRRGDGRHVRRAHSRDGGRSAQRGSIRYRRWHQSASPLTAWDGPVGFKWSDVTISP